MAKNPNAPKTPGKTAGKPAGGRAGKPRVAQDGASAPGAVGEDGAEAPAKAANGLRLKELVDRVAAVTGGKKNDVKGIVEATLTQMGAALQKGETLNLPAFGKMRVARAGAEGGGAMTLKLRQGAGSGKGKAGKGPLADAQDQD